MPFSFQLGLFAWGGGGAGLILIPAGWIWGNMQPCLARCRLNLEGGFSDRRCEQLHLNGEGFIFLGVVVVVGKRVISLS